jgi:hypothetical protein
VRAEVLPGRGLADEAVIAAAGAKGWLRQTEPSPAEPALPDLDEGEAACIRIALAHAGPSLLLMDERAGRAIAAEHGLRVAGTAGRRRHGQDAGPDPFQWIRVRAGGLRAPTRRGFPHFGAGDRDRIEAGWRMTRRSERRRDG